MSRTDDVRLRVAQRLEAGAWNGVAARVLSHAWSAVAARAVARPLTWPAGHRLVAVGGATLGGSGKTPLAIACAKELAKHGRVALVAHGYGALPGAARVVRGDDGLAEVGDEALVAARALGATAPVVVARTRQAAVDHAARLAEVLVIDGVLQTSPRRASLSLLALDAESPWGAGAVPPRGDLRSPVASLIRACDRAVIVEAASRGAYHAGQLLEWSSLSKLRLGVFVALARPHRLLAGLRRAGVAPAHVVKLGDHAPPPLDLSSRLAALRCDLWLASAKCATKLEVAGIPHATLEHEALLPGSLLSTLAALHEVPRILSQNAPLAALLALTLTVRRRYSRTTRITAISTMMGPSNSLSTSTAPSRHAQRGPQQTREPFGEALA